MNTYEFIELVEYPVDQDDLPDEEDLDYWQFELLEELSEKRIEQELDLLEIVWEAA